MDSSEDTSGHSSETGRMRRVSFLGEKWKKKEEVPEIDEMKGWNSNTNPSSRLMAAFDELISVPHPIYKTRTPVSKSNIYQILE